MYNVRHVVKCSSVSSCTHS